MEKEKSKRLRFTYDDDIFLLREVIAHNPLRNPASWETIQRDMETSLGKKFLIKTLKQHLQLLLEMWAKKDNITKIRSGCEDPYSEKDNLLQEVSSICQETDGGLVIKKKKTVSKEKQIAELGRQARESYALNFTNESDVNINDKNSILFDQQEMIGSEEIVCDVEDRDHDYCAELNDRVLSDLPIPDTIPVPDTNLPKKSDTEMRHVLRPIRKRSNKSKPLRKDALGYLSEKNERENTLKNRELELETRKLLLEERKLLLEEKKIDWDITERKEKLEIEKKKMEMMISDKSITQLLLQSQQQLIESLMRQLERYNSN